MKDRIVHLDYLRVISSLAVILLHIVSIGFDAQASSPWIFHNILNCACRWAVPCYIMISGTLLIGKPISYKDFLKKNVLKLTICYFAWSLIYALIKQFGFIFVNGSKFNTTEFLQDFIEGHYHLWYLPVTIGLYLMLPVLQKICESKTATKIFLTIGFIFCVLLPEIRNLLSDFAGQESSAFYWFTLICDTLLGNTSLFNFSVFAFYFVLGHVLSTVEIPRATQKCIYILGILGYAFMFILEYLAVCEKQINTQHYMEYRSLWNFLESIAVFTLLKNLKYTNEKLNSRVAFLSKNNFGCYLTHAAILDFFTLMGFSVLTVNPAIATPILFAVVTVLAYLASWILSKIPIVNRWLV